MYGRSIRFAINKHVPRVHPLFFSSSVSPQPSYNKNQNLVDDIIESASGMPPAPSSGAVDHRVNVVKTSTTPTSPSSSSPGRRENSYDRREHSYDRREKRGHEAESNYVAQSVKQGVVKAMETGLEIGEMAKKTLDHMWDATKDTTHKVKKVVAGEEDNKYDVPPTDHFVDDLRKHADGYDRRTNVPTHNDHIVDDLSKHADGYDRRRNDTPTDNFVDDLRKRADGYNQRMNH